MVILFQNFLNTHILSTLIKFVVDGFFKYYFLIKNKLWLQVNGKGNKYGKIPVTTALELRLNEYRSAYNLPLASTLIDKVVISRLNRVSPHWLRHTSATIQINSGIDIRVVQANLRHSSIHTTMLYLHLDDDLRHHETISKFAIHTIS